MLQKIKYPVGSKIKNKEGFETYIIDVSKNEYVCLISGGSYFGTIYHQEWLTQETLDAMGYTLVSSPRWIPEIGEIYCFWTDTQWIQEKDWRGEEPDLFRLKQGKVFKTIEECQKKIDEINSREI